MTAPAPLPPALRLSWTAVREILRARILARDYAPGDRIPRDEDLAAELGCARATVHRAMQDLAAAGLVDRRRKGGTHVPADPVTRATLEIPITRREIEDRGLSPGYRLIARDLAESPPQVMARMGQTRALSMLRVQALHMADGRPYLLEDRWISLAAVPAILDVDLGRESANEWLVRHKPASRVEMRFAAVEADGETARHLEVAPGRALLASERTTWLGDDPITTVRATGAPGHVIVAQS